MTVAFRKPVHAPSAYHFRSDAVFCCCCCSSWSYGVLLYEILTVGELGKLFSLLVSYCLFYSVFFFIVRIKYVELIQNETGKLHVPFSNHIGTTANKKCL